MNSIFKEIQKDMDEFFDHIDSILDRDPDEVDVITDHLPEPKVDVDKKIKSLRNKFPGHIVVGGN
jgi:hypothetical protein|tara:strand:+ start:787 stop:981 length:195 start_codon:yes stop_codon:yes gene_type:complete